MAEETVKSRDTVLTVIIPAHNASATIGEQLGALATQDWRQPWELLVVNNRCSDNTVDIVQRFQSAIPYLRVIEAHARAGAAYAINTGARAARAPAIALCDADDVVGSGWVAAMAEGLCRYPFVSGPLEVERLNGQAVPGRVNPQPSGIQQYREPPFLPHAAAANMGIRREVFEALGGFDETMMAVFETDFCWRAQLAGVPLTPLPDAIVHYRYRTSLASVLRQAETYARYNVLLYKRYRTLGMPPLPLKRGVRAWLHILREIPRIHDRERLGRWVWDLGWRLGRLRGSIAYRVFSP